MKVFKNEKGLQLLEDNINMEGGTILNSPVTIKKESSSSFGKKAEIVNVRNNYVVVKLEDNSHRTYSFENLSN